MLLILYIIKHSVKDTLTFELYNIDEKLDIL